MLQDYIWNAQCSWSMFDIRSWNSMLFKYGSGAFFKIINGPGPWDPNSAGP